MSNTQDLSLLGSTLTSDGNGADVTGSVTADGLTVETSADPAVITLRHTGNTSGLIIKNFSAGESQLVNVDNGPMVFKTNDAEAMRIDASGNVGIGTNLPIYDFQIGTYGTDADSTLALATSTSGTGSIRFGDGTSGTEANQGLIRYDHSDTSMVFWTSATERMRIDSQGRVGIKTPNPTSLLHIFDGQGGTNAQTDLLTLQTQRSDFGSGGSSILFFDTESPPTTSGGNASSRGRIKAYTENADEFQTDFRFSLSDRSDSAITSISADTTTITVVHVTSVGLGVEVGDYVSIQGTTNFNEDFVVTGVDSNTQFTIAATGYDGFAEETSGNVAKSETFDRMVITGNGNVGIGTASPSEPLTVLSAQDYQITAAYNASNSTSYGYYGIKNNNTGNPFYFHVGGTEAMRIDASGRVLLNRTASTGSLTLESQAPSGFSVGSGFYSGSTQSTIEFKDTNTTANYKVRIGSQTDDMIMFAGGAERMRIDAIGLLEVQHDVYAGMQRSLTLSNPRNDVGTGDGTSIYFNNTGTSTIARSAYIGGVSEENYGQSNALVFGTSSGGNAPTEAMRIDSSGHAIIPAGVTLGTAVGTYNAANTLDDYEEGTFTPVLNSSATAPTVTYSLQKGRYTKVGNLVTILVDCRWSTNSGGTGNTTITGLPFANGDSYAGGIVFEHNSAWSYASGRTNLSAEVNQNTGIVTFLQNGTGLSAVGYDITTLGSFGYVIFSVTFRTA